MNIYGKVISKSTTRFRHRMRCNDTHNCGHRFTLKRKPTEQLKCPLCGKNASSVEKQRANELKKQDTHSCYHYPFPHKKASLPFCSFNHNRMMGFEPTKEEIQIHESVLSTDRTAHSYGSDVPEIPF